VSGGVGGVGWVGLFLALDFAHEVPECRLAGLQPGRFVTIDESIEALAQVANVRAEPGEEGKDEAAQGRRSGDCHCQKGSNIQRRAGVHRVLRTRGAPQPADEAAGRQQSANNRPVGL